MPHKTSEARRAWRKRYYAENPDKYVRDLLLSREAKQRRTGVCVSCGAETRYHGREQNGPSRLCVSCASREAWKPRLGTGSVQRRLYALLEPSTAVRYSVIRDTLGLSNNHIGVLLNREVEAGRLRRVSRGWYVRG